MVQGAMSIDLNAYSMFIILLIYVNILYTVRYSLFSVRHRFPK